MEMLDNDFWYIEIHEYESADDEVCAELWDNGSRIELPLRVEWIEEEVMK